MVSKDRNLVLVVDDDIGMLRAIKRLLQQHDYEPILFSSAQAFKSHTDFERAACVILDIIRRVRHRAEIRAKFWRGEVNVQLHRWLATRAALKNECMRQRFRQSVFLPRYSYLRSARRRRP